MTLYIVVSAMPRELIIAGIKIPESAYRVVEEIAREVGATYYTTEKDNVLELILRVLQVREDLRREIVEELKKRRRYVVVLNRYVFSFPELGLEV